MRSRYRRPETEVRLNDVVVARSSNHNALFTYGDRNGVRQVIVEVRHSEANVQVTYNNDACCSAHFSDAAWAAHVMRNNAAKWGARFILRDGSKRKSHR